MVYLHVKIIIIINYCYFSHSPSTGVGRGAAFNFRLTVPTRPELRRGPQMRPTGSLNILEERNMEVGVTVWHVTMHVPKLMLLHMQMTEPSLAIIGVL